MSDDALGQLGQRLRLRRQHGREHEPRGDRRRAPLAPAQRHVPEPHDQGHPLRQRGGRPRRLRRLLGGRYGGGDRAPAPTAVGDTIIKVTSIDEPRRRHRRSRSTRPTPRTRSSRPSARPRRTRRSSRRRRCRRDDDRQRGERRRHRGRRPRSASTSARRRHRRPSPAVGTAQRTATTLAAAAAAGDTNIKVACVTNMVVGENDRGRRPGSERRVRHDRRGRHRRAPPARASRSSPLTIAHASGAPAQDLGSGVTLTAPLSSAHPSGARVVDTSALGTGITLTAPLDEGARRRVDGERPGHGPDLRQPAGPDHRRAEQRPGRPQLPGAQVGHRLLHEQPPGRAGRAVVQQHQRHPGLGGREQRLRHRRDPAAPAQPARRAGVPHAAADAVTQAIADLGQKYNFSIPLENPLVFKNTGSVPDSPGIQTVPAYLPGDQALYTPVLDDRTGRTDQVSFGIRGIPSLGDIGQYDSSTDPLVGGADNPYPSGYPSKPTLAGRVRPGLDRATTSRTSTSGPPGPCTGRAATTSRRKGCSGASSSSRRGSRTRSPRRRRAAPSPKPDRPIAYFEMSPKKPTAQTTVFFDAGFSRAKDGSTNGLTYYWDFGDGSPVVDDDRPADPAHVPDPGGVA